MNVRCFFRSRPLLYSTCSVTKHWSFEVANLRNPRTYFILHHVTSTNKDPAFVVTFFSLFSAGKHISKATDSHLLGKGDCCLLVVLPSNFIVDDMKGHCNGWRQQFHEKAISSMITSLPYSWGWLCVASCASVWFRRCQRTKGKDGAAVSGNGSSSSRQSAAWSLLCHIAEGDCALLVVLPSGSAAVNDAVNEQKERTVQRFLATAAVPAGD